MERTGVEGASVLALYAQAVTLAMRAGCPVLSLQVRPLSSCPHTSFVPLLLIHAVTSESSPSPNSSPKPNRIHGRSGKALAFERHAC